MTITTLCYIENDGKYLMLHRVKKQNDINKGKWIGVGGHTEDQESPEECLLREVKEETGLTLTSYKFRGLVTFINSECESELMCVFTADGYTGRNQRTTALIHVPAIDDRGNNARIRGRAADVRTAILAKVRSPVC